jgi:hypothetical protein
LDERKVPLFWLQIRDKPEPSVDVNATAKLPLYPAAEGGKTRHELRASATILGKVASRKRLGAKSGDGGTQF